MRSFGRVEDLDLEFVNADRPTLVTSLLALCAGGDADHWWMQPVGIRAAALLDLLAFDQRSDRMELSAACARTACGVTFGFELPLRDLAAQVSRDETWQVALADGRHVILRRPIGRDLLRWRAAQPGTREQALRMMLDDLVLDGEVGPGDIAAIADAVIASDPLVALDVAAECPACGHVQDVAVDAEGLALLHFGRRQRVLLHEVHRLATRYGWTEPEVLAVPAPRRAVYLALLDGEAA
jgi:hypothetical protein